MKQKIVLTFPAALLSLLVLGNGPAQGQDPTKTGGTTTGATTTGAATAGGSTTGAASTTGQTATVTTTGSPATGQTRGQTPGTAPNNVKLTTIPGTQKPGSKPPLPKPPKMAWEEFKLNSKTTMFLDFTESNPDMVLSIFSRTSGITILKDPSFKSTLTVTSAKAVGLKEAFEILNTMLGMNGYELKKQGNLMVVAKKQAAPPPMQMPPPQPAPPPQPEANVVKVYKLEFASSKEVARVVNDVFSPQALQEILQRMQGGQPGGFPGGGPQFPGQPGQQQPPKAVKASSEDFTNSVVVSATPKLQTEVENLIKELDKNSDSPVESEIFRINYVPVDDAVDAIQNVLNANKPTGRGARSSNSNDNSFGYFYGYNPFGSNRSSNGGESVIAVKQTNSVIVSATKANMIIVKRLIENLDVKSNWIGTTFVVKLENAKATDVADLLNKVFTKRRDQGQDDNPFFFFYSDGFGDNNKKKDSQTDMNEAGEIVNVRDLTGKVNVIADPNTNSLIFATLPSNMHVIRGIVDQLDRIADQVVIETIIVEANLDRTTKLGVEYNFVQGHVLDWNANAAGGWNFGVQGANPAPQGFTYTLNGSGYKAFVNALQSDNRFKVLSTPRIFTSNNVKSEINVSQKVPYITDQQASGIGGGLLTKYDFKDVGVVLNVTPRVTASGEVIMDVTQQADDLQGFTTFNAPIINHRQAQTTVSVKDGETVILGGIIRSTVNNTQTKIPLLGDIPLLGYLFRNTNRQHQQTELMVLLTPRIVRDPVEARRLREEEMKRLSKGSQDAVNKNINPPPGP